MVLPEIGLLQRQIDDLQAQVAILQGLLADSGSIGEQLKRLNDIREMRMGAGDTAFHADQEGFWWGKETMASAKTGGTAILMDGNIYPKGGVSGTSTPMTGGVTVVRGIVTAIT